MRLNANSAPWFGLACAKVRLKKVAVWKLWHSHPSEAARRSYRQVCKEARRTYLESRRCYFHSLATGVLNDPSSSKCFWRAINASMGRSRGTSIPTLLHDGREFCSSRAKAEILNCVFAEKAALADTGLRPPILDKVTDSILDSVNFDSAEVLLQLKSLKLSKATGPDGISARVLRECASVLAPSLFRMFSLSLNSGQVPKEWKHARVTACHKTGAKSNPVNYRPISLLPIASKVLERIVTRRLQTFLNNNGSLPERQFGFRPSRSSLDLAASTTQCWANALDKGEEVRVVSLDLTRAFDRVWHPALLAKLRACGVDGVLLKWIEDFLPQ